MKPWLNLLYIRELQWLVDLERARQNSKIKVKVGNTPINERTLETIWGFFAIYVFVFLIVLLLLMLSGLDFLTSFSAVAATINNLGPGQGEVLYNYADISTKNSIKIQQKTIKILNKINSYV